MSLCVLVGFEVYFYPCRLNTGGSVTTCPAADHVTVTSGEPSTTGLDFQNIIPILTYALKKEKKSLVLACIASNF